MPKAKPDESKTSNQLMRLVANFLPRRTWLRRLTIGFIALVIVLTAVMYGIGQWYVHSEKNKPLQMGVTFIPAYARSLGVDPEQTMDGLINIGVKRFRLVSYWDQIEANPGRYDYSELDWQVHKAEATHASISLAIGLRQPRWPECHTPGWAQNKPLPEVQSQLNAFIKTTIERYKHSPSLKSYQLENEYFNRFGQCTDFSRQRLVTEYNLAKKTDSRHPIIVSRSNNSILPATGDPQPDLTGVSIYRRVWDTNTKRYFTYPLPTWYYAFNAGLQKITTGRDSIVHELQMEAWPPNGKGITDISMAEQDKSMNASMFQDRIQFAKDTGMRQIDLWGAEWWYWRLQHGDQSIWQEAQKAFNEDH